MSKREPPLILNLDDIDAKRRLMSKIQRLTGLWEITLQPRRRTRTLNQNAYYFAAFVTPFREWLNENWGESFDLDQAHTQLKIAVLGMDEKVNKQTGEIIELVPTSRFKDTAEFSDYLEKAAEFLARNCQIVVLPSELFSDDSKRKLAHKPKIKGDENHG